LLVDTYISLVFLILPLMCLSANYNNKAARAVPPALLYMSHPHVNLSRIHVDLARLLHAQVYPRICKKHAKV
jgi:hypothetical protein